MTSKCGKNKKNEVAHETIAECVRVCFIQKHFRIVFLKNAVTSELKLFSFRNKA